MNWLAHLLLSGPSPASRIGGLLPDLASPSELKDLPPEFQAGIQLHHRIDAFTDSHPTFRASVRRLPPPLRRFGPILVDVFYDHFLASDWPLYSNLPLESFVQSVHSSFGEWHDVLPPGVRDRLAQIKNANWLCSYRELEGIALALERLGRRFRKPVDLSPGMAALQHHYLHFHHDFQAFFPELIDFLRRPGSTSPPW